MFISQAYAAATETAATVAGQSPGAWEAFAWNMGLVLILVVLFYVLLIMPQQRRFKEHKSMLDSLKKGDDVITGGGLVGKVDKINDENEVVVDLGGMKVTALRSTLQTRGGVLNPDVTEDKGKNGEQDNKKTKRRSR